MKKNLLIIVLATAGVLVAMTAWAGPPLPPPPPFGFGVPGFSFSINTPTVHARVGRDHHNRYRHDRYRHDRRRHHRRGHWEVRKVWVPPVTKQVWNPGHYTRKGRWIRGEWIEVEKRPGYWTKERIRVADRTPRGRHRGRRGYR